MRQWIVPIALISLLSACSAQKTEPSDAVNPAGIAANAVDPQVKHREDVGIFVKNNAGSLASFAMKFAKSDDLVREIEKIVKAQPDSTAKIKADDDGWKAPSFLQPEGLNEIYQARRFAPIFVNNSKLTSEIDPLVTELNRLESHGLAKRIDVQPWLDAKTALESLSVDKSDEPFVFTPEEEQIIVDQIIAKDIDVSNREAVAALVTELVKSETILPRLHKAVADRAHNMAQTAKQAARLDVLTADLAMRFAREMSFNNMTHLTEEESAGLSAKPTKAEHNRIAVARTNAWLKNLVAVVDAPTPGLKEKAADDTQNAPEGEETPEPAKDADAGSPAADAEAETEAVAEENSGIEDANDAIAAETEAANAQKERMDNATTVQELIDALYPAHPGYHQLMDAHDRYAAMPDWGEVSSATLKAGKSAKIVPALKKRLAIEGYYHGDTSDTTSDIYDDEVRAAVRFYHESHQLAYDESKGLQKGFWQSLNTPRQTRLDQIDENLRRWHQSQVIQSPYYIFINVPDFHGEVWRDGKMVYRFPVVAGNARRSCDPQTKTWKYINATPLMHARMLYIEYNPYWIVPPRIEQEDYIEKINADPNWLKDHGFEYYTENGRTVLRQLPSERNALGRVKFIFPNPHSTFLHDSPQKGLFKYPVRAFSHGCMRVWEPLELAKRLLEYDGQWKKKIAEDIEDLEPRRFHLKNRFDVFIDYLTVRVDDDGIVYFLADPYHYVRDALEPPSARSLQCTPNPKGWIPRAALQGDVGADESGAGTGSDAM